MMWELGGFMSAVFVAKIVSILKLISNRKERVGLYVSEDWFLFIDCVDVCLVNMFFLK